MQKYCFPIILVLSLNTAHLVRAQNYSNFIYKQYSGTKLKLLKLTDWQAPEGLHGGNLTLIGPENNGPRPVIKIDVVKIPNDWSLVNEKKNTQTYLKHRKEWLSGKSGVYIDSKLGIEEKMGQEKAHNSLRNELTYELNGNEFYEEDMIIQCPKSLVNMTYLVTSKKKEAFSGMWQKFKATFKCS